VQIVNVIIKKKLKRIQQKKNRNKDPEIALIKMKYYFVDYTKRVLKSRILYDKLVLIATCKKIQ